MTASARRVVRLEHRLIQPNASLRDLDSAVALAGEHDLAALTVSPWLVKPARRQLGRSRLQLGTVVAFPHGGQLLSVKAFEASKALEHGATLIDFVLNAGALASDDDETVFNDMLAVVDMAHSALAVVGVIVEPQPLPEALVRKACRLAERAGADYVVTGTGDAPARTTILRTRVLRDSVGPRVQVKAAGRMRGAEQIRQAFASGATRVALPLSAPLIRQLADAPDPVAVAG